MLGAIYTSLSGMRAYRTGLDVISNNIANMNTPGFKLADPLFRDLVQHYGGSLGNGNSSSQIRGAGVQASESTSSFQQGDLRETGNSLDAAVDGNGFFVLDLNGQRLYTRAGQFEFDKDGILVERGSGARVLVSTDASGVGFFDLNTQRVFPPRATTEVNIAGTLARAGTSSSYEIPQPITVIDTSGARQVIRARFNRDAADAQHWTVEIVNTDNVILGTGSIRFNADGTPATNESSFTVSITTSNNTPAYDVLFNFGVAGSYGGATSISGTTTSNLQLLRQNGLELGSITKTTFDDQGRLEITYSNGEKRTPARLLLASFDSPDQLTALGSSHYVFSGGREPTLGNALTGGMGKMIGGKLEMSNVDLTNQFTDLIIVQRGFQGSSQITSVANEMMQQLLAMSGAK